MPSFFISFVAMCFGLPPSRMSVPRPAMLVATVMAPLRPAWATMSASRAWNLALRTECFIPRASSRRPRCSEFSTLVVPTRMGRFVLFRDLVGDGVPLLVAGAVDQVVAVFAYQRAVGGHGGDVEAVDLGELGGLDHCRSCRTACCTA